MRRRQAACGRPTRFRRTGRAQSRCCARPTGPSSAWARSSRSPASLRCSAKSPTASGDSTRPNATARSVPSSARVRTRASRLCCAFCGRRCPWREASSDTEAAARQALVLYEQKRPSRRSRESEDDARRDWSPAMKLARPRVRAEGGANAGERHGKRSRIGRPRKAPRATSARPGVPGSRAGPRQTPSLPPPLQSPSLP